MGQGAESGGKVFKAFLQQYSGHGVNHLALQSDLYSGLAIELPVFGIDRHHGMNKLMDEDTEIFDRLYNIGAKEDFKMIIGGR